MADKNIGSLPNIATLTDDSLFVAEQQGEAGNVTGRQFRRFAEAAAAAVKKGDPGKDFQILGYYDTLDKLRAAQPAPEAGDAYGVGTTYPYTIYIWDGVGLDWKNNGTIQGPPGDKGNPGAVFTPHVAANGDLSWTNNGDLDNPPPVNVRGPIGPAFTYDDFTQQQLEKLRGPIGPAFTYEDFTEEQLAALVGPAGSSIQSVNRTAGNGASGTTDTYTITLTDGRTTQFYVYNGKDGEGAGDMTSGVYDPQGKKTDVFKYVDDKLADIDVDVTADEVTFADGDTFQNKYDSGELTGPVGPAGKDGQPGKDGATGPAGADGAHATINGVNALTLKAQSPIKATQSGSTLTLGLDGDLPIGSTAYTHTLTTSGWSDNGDGRFKQTISVPGVTTDPEQVIMVDAALTGTDLDADAATLGAWGPDDGSGPSSQNVAQGSGTLTFYCTVVPTVNIPVNVGVS